MKRYIDSALVVIITIVTLFVMSTIEPPATRQTSGQVQEETYNDEMPEGTGYIFDDFEKGININMNEEENTSTTNKNNKINVSLERSRKIMLEMNQPPPKYVEFNFKENEDNTYDTSKEVKKVEEKISIKDKLYLLKIARNLKSDDINVIKKAIYNGETNEETEKIWSMLKNKLSEDEYSKLVEIINKYEQ